MKCKKCGKKITNHSTYLTKYYGMANAIRFMRIMPHSQISMRPIPLCKTCIAELENWLESGGTNE